MPSRHNGSSELPPARRPVPHLLKWPTGIAALVAWTLLIGASIGNWSDTIDKLEFMLGGIAVTLAFLAGLLAVGDWLNRGNQHRYTDSYRMLVAAVGRRHDDLSAQLAMHAGRVGQLHGLMSNAVDQAFEAGAASYWRGLADGRLGRIDPPKPRTATADEQPTGTAPERRGPIGLVPVDN